MSGLPPFSSEDSLEPSSEGGLAPVTGAPKFNMFDDGVEEDGGLYFGFLPSAMKLPTITCTGPAALSIPATPPPTTLPSAPASETLKLHVLLPLPLLSDGENEPDKEIISNRPSNVTVPPRDDDGWRRVALHIAPLAERMQTVLGPCCEKVIIFLAISSPACTVITWGVKPIPVDPRASNCLFPEPGGLPRAFLG